MNNMRNKVQLIGNVGNAPEIKETGNGKNYAKFSIATNERYKDQNGKMITDTQWHNITAWGKQAEFVEKYVSKGTEICLEGKLQNNNYKDKDGVTKYVTNIIANEILLLSKKEK